jgi:hypothetical protein
MKKNRKKALAEHLQKVIDRVAGLRDSKLNPCNTEDGEECTCHRFDEILDLLENLKEI